MQTFLMFCLYCTCKQKMNPIARTPPHTQTHTSQWTERRPAVPSTQCDASGLRLRKREKCCVRLVRPTRLLHDRRPRIPRRSPMTSAPLMCAGAGPASLALWFGSRGRLSYSSRVPLSLHRRMLLLRLRGMLILTQAQTHAKSKTHAQAQNQPKAHEQAQMKSKQAQVKVQAQDQAHAQAHADGLTEAHLQGHVNG